MKVYKSLLPEIRLKLINGDMHKAKITSSRDCADLFVQMFDTDMFELQEQFICMYLNRANITIGWFKVSSGGLTGTVVDPKLIFATALKCGACSLILSHNHPSGNKQPSQADIDLTRKCKDAGKLLDINVLDHLICTSEGYFSFADEGLV